MTNGSEDLAPYIDHTLLKPEATPDQVRVLCSEAARYRFRTVCVNSRYAALAAAELARSPVQICCVVGFPLGAMHSDAKAFEARTAIADGAGEIDMVIAIGAALAGDWDAVRSDIEAVYRACDGVPLKVIFETCQLTDDQIRTLCRLCTEIGVAFVKTSTGFGSGGATLEQVRLMVASVGQGVQVKASGGIRDRATALAMIEAGATRLGTSSGVAIVQGQTCDKDY